MTPHLPVVQADQLASVAQRLGFELDRQKGSHAGFLRKTDNARIVIPMHCGKALKPKTLAAIIDDMGISVDQLRKLL